METINKKDLKEHPTKNGWYLCRYTDEDYEIEDDQTINYTSKVLYWQDNLWLKSPFGDVCVEERDILDWIPMPDYFATETAKVNM